MDMDEEFGQRPYYTILVLMFLVPILGGGISLFFTGLIGNFIIEQKIMPQIEHAQFDASADIPKSALADWERPETAMIFEKVHSDAASSADIVRTDFFNKEGVMVWSSTGLGIGSSIPDSLLFRSLEGESAFRKGSKELAGQLGVANLLEIFVPISLSEERIGHSEEDEIAENEETPETEFQGEVDGVIKLYMDDTHIIRLRKKLYLYIWGLTFGTILITTSILYYVFRKQYNYLLKANERLLNIAGQKKNQP